MTGADPDVAAAVAATKRVLGRLHPELGVTINALTVLDEADIQSMELVEILIEMEQLTGTAVVTDDLSGMRTVGDIATLSRVNI